MLEQRWPLALKQNILPFPTERKLRLLAVACCRRQVRVAERVARILDVCERDADETAGWNDLTAVWKEASRELKRMKGWGSESRRALRYAATAANPDAAVAVANLSEDDLSLDLIECIFGDPARSVVVDPAWLAWNDGLIPRLARVIYSERAFHDLPILGDALEEAGCSHEHLLSHCRQGRSHVLGCWAVDLCLGKS
jgi:hypothetical protein